jgi:N-methylhydantoinase A/oxoprolinase/acetone carboxylase beta subunit
VTGRQFRVVRSGTATDIVARCQDSRPLTREQLVDTPAGYADAGTAGVRGLHGPGDGSDLVRTGATDSRHALLERAAERLLPVIETPRRRRLRPTAARPPSSRRRER